MQIDIDGQPLSGLRSDVGNDCGLVILLHGGGYDARYRHHPGYRELGGANALGCRAADQACAFFATIQALLVSVDHRVEQPAATDVSGMPLDYPSLTVTGLRERLDQAQTVDGDIIQYADRAIRRAPFYGPDSSSDPVVRLRHYPMKRSGYTRERS
ncbi:MAG: hypothetical protein EPO08_00540 [Rhodospirillaceae bacterium]|nr:MAG: hypothetical protein EPO08_00540 [Rhodospirillaceae bacterium]